MTPRFKRASRKFADRAVRGYSLVLKFITTANAFHTFLIILGVAGGVSTVFAVALQFAKRYAITIDITTNVFLIEFIIIACIVILHKLLQYFIGGRDLEPKNQEEILKILSNMAYKNSRCDGKLFDTFHLIVAGPSPGTAVDPPQNLLELYAQSKDVVETNIKENLNCTVSLFTAFTGDSCSACIKLVRQVHGEIKLEVVFRDLELLSVKDRLNNYMYNLADNTSFDEISRGRLKYYANDDLKSATEADKYRNGRPNWNKDYNATLVLPLRSMRSGERAPEAGRIVGFLCIDNKQGGFENENAFHLAKGICSRLEVIFHRLAVFEQELAS